MAKFVFDEVFDIVKLIPHGRVTSYGAIAKYLGTGARMVGWAMNASHVVDGVPAHRVVNSIGVLSGKNHFGGNRMQELLEAEGIKVVKDKVVDFNKLFWNPTDELL